MRTLSVIIPVYNGAGSISELVDQLTLKLPELASEFEIILVEDDGKDNSWQVIQEVVARVEHVRGFKLMRNYGQHNALLCGIRAARYETIVTMDDDLQHPPDEIIKLLNKYDEGYDVVYGRPEKETHTLFRNLASQVTKLVLQNAMGADTARNISAFRVFRTRLRDAFAYYRGPSVNLDVLLTWGSTRFAAIPVRHEPRKIGRSNYTLRRLITHSLNMITGFSTLPLQAASMLGFALTIFGLIVLAYVLIRFLIEGGSVPGFPFLASLIAVFSGAQMLAIGIIGEYLARMHLRMMDRPAYVVREGLPEDVGAVIEAPKPKSGLHTLPGTGPLGAP
jgi:undecaprenyl-phosphate 4-deoxy-4-formamido-L-arabinose transferase